MGMAMVAAYPRPRVRKTGNVWRVTWCEADNRVWYTEASSWNRAIAFATTGKMPYGVI